MNNLRCYQEAVKLYKECEKLKSKYYIKDQLMRASLSIVLNLAEGSGKLTEKDRARFFRIALGSTREVKAIMELLENIHLYKRYDLLTAQIYKLSLRPGRPQP